MSTATKGADIAIIGLAVMGQNLALNIADRGFAVAAYNRSPAKTDDLLARAGADHKVSGHRDLASLVDALRSPRVVLVMVQAGGAVDSVIADLVPLLDEGDIVIDAGNSHHADSQRRFDSLASQGIHFIGAGVSGGEEGARFGPSIMPGGDRAAWPTVEPILTAIAADAGPNGDEPCCEWLGGGGAGHFVKMVHNGIEYGDMQVLAEAQLLLDGAGHAPAEQAKIVGRWNEGRLESYLVEITAEILATTDDDGQPILDIILDAAGQKGTGRWTAVEAMELGQPMTLVIEAVAARSLSAMVDLRAAVADVHADGDSADLDTIDLDSSDLEAAVYASKLVSYAQGFMVLQAASDEHGWDLDLRAIARLWRGGCIIRAAFLDDIARAYVTDPKLTNLVLDPYLATELSATVPGLRRTVIAAAHHGIPIPGMASALAFFDGLRRGRGSAALIQAQRDYFGAHTYERVDRPRGEWFHTDWINSGGAMTSGSYST